MEHTNRFDRAGVVGNYDVASVQWAQLEPGRFDIGFEVLDAAPVRLSKRTFNVGMQVDAEVLGRKIVIGCMTHPQTSARCFGTEIDMHHVVITKREINLLTRGPASYCNVAIEENDLEPFSNAPDVQALLYSRGTIISREPVTATRLRESVDRIFSLNKQIGTRALPYGVPARVVSGTLVPLLGNAIERYGSHAVKSSKSHGRRLAAVRNCVAYMHAHLDASVTLLDLSALSGLHSHSLINAFVAITGLSPMDYLKKLRLNRCHAALQCADKRETRVIDIATEWGFWHMGHFAFAYRAMFGETPSQTLSRSHKRSYAKK